MFPQAALPDWPLAVAWGRAAPAGQQTVGEGGGVAQPPGNNGQGLELELEADSKSAAAPGDARPWRNRPAPHRKDRPPRSHTHTHTDKEEQWRPHPDPGPKTAETHHKVTEHIVLSQSFGQRLLEVAGRQR